MLLDEAHDPGGEDALGNGCGPEVGVGGHGKLAGGVAEAEDVGPDKMAVVEDGELCAGDVVGG